MYAITVKNNLIGDVLSPVLMIFFICVIFYGFVIRENSIINKCAGCLLAFAFLIWFFCDVYWAIQSLILNTNPEENAINICGYYFFNLFLLFSLGFRAYVDLKKINKIQALLDTVIVVICFGVLLWVFVFKQNNENVYLLLSNPAAMMCLAIDIIIYAWINVWAFSARNLKPPLCRRMFMLGCLLFIITDLFYFYTYFYSDYDPNSWIDGAYIISFLIMVLEAICKIQKKEKGYNNFFREKRVNGFGIEILILIAPLSVLIFKKNQMHYFALLVLSILVYYILINFTQKSIFQGKMLELERLKVSELLDKNRQLIQAHEIINKEKVLLKTTLRSLSDGVISTDKDGNVEIMNNVAENLTGWSNEEAYGKSFEAVFRIIDETTREIYNSPVLQVIETGKKSQIGENILLLNKNGMEIPIEDGVAPILNGDEIIGTVVVFRDCTEKRQKQEEIVYLSYHDQLTGLYNRHYFEEELKRLDVERNLPFSLAMIDVNGLKLTNDAFGHQTGDKLLQIVADSLKSKCRADDIITRIGGDEFVLLLPKTSYEEAGDIIDRIYDDIGKVSFQNIVVSVSIGWETKTLPEQSLMETLTKAEKIMYQRKLNESPAMRLQTIQNIMQTLNSSSERMKNHSENVRKISRKIGELMNLDAQKMEELEMAAYLHDIGKVSVKKTILKKVDELKNDELSKEEAEEYKKHSEVGYHILKSVDLYSNLAEIVLGLHENFDGTGYPRGIKGEEIPLATRIIAIADTYETLNANLFCEQKKNKEEVFENLNRYAGTVLDPYIVKVLCDNF